MVNNYTPIDNADDIEEGTFNYQQYGKTVYRHKDAWKDIKREDYIFYEHKKHESEFKDNICINWINNSPSTTTFFDCGK